MDIDTRGLAVLFEALNKPCECEKGIRFVREGARTKRITECARDPFPYPGYRWYREEVEPASGPHTPRRLPFRRAPIRPASSRIAA
ncbi:MAG: hypothetical protein KGL39_12765 [Patescibacteria group bacterium]|nr:hypothetical protein [Patescibacteria group bacterium]